MLRRHWVKRAVETATHIINERSSGSRRIDDGETMVLARQMEHILTETFDIEYAELRVLEFVPLDTTIPANARTFTYREWDVVGAAKIISSYSQDLPRVDAFVKEYPQKIVDFGDAYGYSYPELQDAAFAGVQLDSTKARVAKEACDRLIDAIVSFGDTSTGLKGFLNHPNVPRLNATTGAWTNPATSPDLILADLAAAIAAIIITTVDRHHPTTLLLPLTHYQVLSSRPRSANSDTTILSFFLATNGYVNEVKPWNRLSTAGPGSAPMAVLYQKSPAVLRAVVPVVFDQLPPEIRNLEFLVNCIGRIGGCVWYRPLAGLYIDNI